MNWHNILIRPEDLWEELIRRKLISGGGLPVYEATSTTGMFYTDMTAPLKKLLLSLEPIQSGSGTPSPSNARPISGRTEVVTQRTGVNAWDEEWELGAFNSQGQPTSSSTSIRCKNFIPVVPGQTYYMYSGSGKSNAPWMYGIDKSFLRRSSAYLVNQTFTIPNDVYYIKIALPATYGTTYNNDISINYPSTDHEYHAYDGHAYTTNLGRTVYGGTLDVVSGELVVDRQYLTVANFSSWGGDGVNAGGLHWVNVPKSYPTAVADEGNICSHAENLGANAWLSSVPAYSTAGSFPARIYVASNSYADFRTEYADLQAVYKLAEPQTYQLTPQQINTLIGNNTITAEGADVIEVVYLTHQAE